MKNIRLVLVALLLGGCSVIDLFDPDGESDLRDQMQRWERLGISDYSYDFVRACFCAYPPYPLRITVRDDAVVSIVNAESGEPATNLPAGWAGTIDDVFADLLEMYADGADEIDLRYDRTYHFPVDARIDRIKNAIDDELNLMLSNFQPLR